MTTERITHEEARKIAQRFIDRHFGNRDANGREIFPRVSIPARPDYDDDLRLTAYISQQESLDSAHPGTEVPNDTRCVLARFGDTWSVVWHDGRSWLEGDDTLRFPPSEWRELPEVPRG